MIFHALSATMLRKRPYLWANKLTQQGFIANRPIKLLKNKGWYFSDEHQIYLRRQTYQARRDFIIFASEYKLQIQQWMRYTNAARNFFLS